MKINIFRGKLHFHRWKCVLGCRALNWLAKKLIIYQKNNFFKNSNNYIFKPAYLK